MRIHECDIVSTHFEPKDSNEQEPEMTAPPTTVLRQMFLEALGYAYEAGISTDEAAIRKRRAAILDDELVRRAEGDQAA